MPSITTSKISDYSDIDISFKSNPNLANDVAIKKESAAIRQSVMNILKTNHGEKPFEPLYGANLIQFLFENIDDITARMIMTAVEEAITNYEPRVEILNIRVSAEPDTNEINLTVTVRIISSGETIDVDSTMERLR
jgi:phage baseplate assembly protein W